MSKDKVDRVKKSPLIPDEFSNDYETYIKELEEKVEKDNKIISKCISSIPKESVFKLTMSF